MPASSHRCEMLHPWAAPELQAWRSSSQKHHREACRPPWRQRGRVLPWSFGTCTSRNWTEAGESSFGGDFHYSTVPNLRGHSISRGRHSLTCLIKSLNALHFRSMIGPWGPNLARLLHLALQPARLCSPPRCALRGSLACTHLRRAYCVRHWLRASRQRQRSLAGMSNPRAAGGTLPHGTMRRTSSRAATRRRSHRPTARRQGEWAASPCLSLLVRSPRQESELRSCRRRAP